MIPLSASMLSTKKPKLSNWSLACRKVLPVGGIFFAWDFFVRLHTRFLAWPLNTRFLALLR